MLYPKYKNILKVKKNQIRFYKKYRSSSKPILGEVLSVCPVRKASLWAS